MPLLDRHLLMLTIHSDNFWHQEAFQVNPKPKIWGLFLGILNWNNGRQIGRQHVLQVIDLPGIPYQETILEKIYTGIGKQISSLLLISISVAQFKHGSMRWRTFQALRSIPLWAKVSMIQLQAIIPKLYGPLWQKLVVEHQYVTIHHHPSRGVLILCAITCIDT